MDLEKSLLLAKGFLGENRWMIEIFAAIFFTAFVSWMAGRVLRVLLRFAERTRTDWDEIMVRAAGAPLSVLIWLLGITLAIQLTDHVDQHSPLMGMIPSARAVGIIFLLGWFGLRFVSHAEKSFLKPQQGRRTPDRGTIHAAGQIARVIIIAAAVLITMQSLGMKISGLLAFGGAGAVVAGLAAKDLLANFFGGLMIYLDRPFKVGDWIRSPDRNIEGTVEHIGWRLTRIITFDKRPLYVPNAMFSTIALENPSRMTARRIRTMIGVRYDDVKQLPVIIQEVEAMLKEHDGLDSNQTCYVRLAELADSSLNFLVYAFTKDTSSQAYYTVLQDVFFKILDIIEAHGAECAFPTSTIHVAALPEGGTAANQS